MNDGTSPKMFFVASSLNGMPGIGFGSAILYSSHPARTSRLPAMPMVDGDIGILSFVLSTDGEMVKDWRFGVRTKVETSGVGNLLPGRYLAKFCSDSVSNYTYAYASDGWSQAESVAIDRYQCTLIHPSYWVSCGWSQLTSERARQISKLSAWSPCLSCLGP